MDTCKQVVHLPVLFFRIVAAKGQLVLGGYLMAFSQQRYRQLFDAVPCYISVQDREFRLTATNSLFKEHFGENLSAHCYRIYKNRKSPCTNCPVARRQLNTQVSSKTCGTSDCR